MPADPVRELVLVKLACSKVEHDGDDLGLRCFEFVPVEPQEDAHRHGRFSRKLPGDIQAVALRELRMLSNAHAISDLRSPPAGRLERLSKDREGQHSIRINDRWRVCFVWQDGDAYSVEIVDYH